MLGLRQNAFGFQGANNFNYIALERFPIFARGYIGNKVSVFGKVVPIHLAGPVIVVWIVFSRPKEVDGIVLLTFE